MPPRPAPATFKNIKANLTAGSLSLASLGEVPLPADQLVLDGKHFGNGCWQVPAAGVKFLPIEQVVEAPGLGNVTVKITLSATGDGSGTLPTGGGAASFTLPVQAKLEASLGTIPVIGPEADCFLRPILFDLTGDVRGGRQVGHRRLGRCVLPGRQRRLWRRSAAPSTN